MPPAAASPTTAAATPVGYTACSATTATTIGCSRLPAAVVKHAPLYRAVDGGSPSTTTTPPGASAASGRVSLSGTHCDGLNGTHPVGL